MKKLAFLIIICLVSVSYSQIVRSYGIKLGGTFSIQDNEILPGGQLSRQDIIAFNAGIFSEFLNIPVFSLITEINYVRKGFEATSSDIYYQPVLKWSERIDYLNISVLGKIRLSSAFIEPYFCLGPHIDILLNSSSISQAPKSTYNNALSGMKLGFGSVINIFSVKLITEFLFDYGFQHIDKNDRINITTVDIRLGLSFR